VLVWLREPQPPSRAFREPQSGTSATLKNWELRIKNYELWLRVPQPPSSAFREPQCDTSAIVECIFEYLNVVSQ
jgi:hypothetical protein